MKKCVQHIWKEWKGELLVTALFVPLFWILMDTGYLNDTEIISRVTGGILVLLAAVAGVLLVRRKLGWEQAIWILVAAGIILRMGYVLGTHFYTRTHDCGDIYWYVYGYSEDLGVNDYGHAPYIMYLYLNRQLPHFNQGQFYHPPLFHALSAFAMWLTYKVLKIEDLIYLLSAAQIVSCLASCYTLLMVPKILKELRVRGAGSCVTVGVMAFLPVFTLMASWINNDGLVFYFMTWIVLYTIRWYYRPNWGNTLMLALGFGLGMLSKASCALLALFTGLVMLVRLIRALRKGLQKQKWCFLRKLLVKFVGFGAVAFPLGLFYPIRNLIKFGQPLNYVLRLNIPGLPVMDFIPRFLAFPIDRLFDPVFARDNEYNLNLYLLKTASFGEFSYPESLELLGSVILVANLVLIVLALVSGVQTVRRNRNLFWCLAFPVFWMVLYGSEIAFAWEFPFTCTMDVRYMTPTILFGALYLGKAFSSACTGKGWMIFRSVAVISLAALCVAGISLLLLAGPPARAYGW